MSQLQNFSKASISLADTCVYHLDVQYTASASDVNKFLEIFGLRFCKALRRTKSALLVTCVALTALIASTQQSSAAFYNNYNSYYQYYYNLYLRTGVAQYYYHAIGFYYYYLAGYYGDYFGYYADPLGYKSTTYRGSTTYAGYYYDTFAYYGDYFLHL
jgi:hypothetical protein